MGVRAIADGWKTYLVIYDVEDTKYRNKLVKILESYGIRVQKSAFECYVDDLRLKSMINKIGSLDLKEDSVRVYQTKSTGIDAVHNKRIEMYSRSLTVI